MALKLTIEQTDIESAIEAYVRELIPGLAEGTVIDTDMAATRGPAGFTAEIRILSADESAAQPASEPKGQLGQQTAEIPEAPEQEELAAEAEPAPAPVRRRQVRVSGTKSLGLTKTSDTADLPTETVTETPVENVAAEEPIETAATEETEVEAVADTAPVEEAAAETEAAPAADDSADEAPTDTPVEEAPAPARKSLFSNLKKA